VGDTFMGPETFTPSTSTWTVEVALDLVHARENLLDSLKLERSVSFAACVANAFSVMACAPFGVIRTMVGLSHTPPHTHQTYRGPIPE
jgi:hypothetical protein